MGLGRWLLKRPLVGSMIFLVKDIVEERSLIKGIEKTIKDDFTEDNPLTSHIYKYGKADGKKEGYIQASDEYEIKLLEQADLFINQINDFTHEKELYDALLDEYEKAIKELVNKNNKSNTENELLTELLIKEKMLKEL